MLAGVGPVRLVLFVVAADEGWKPQSEEHLQIVDVLGVEGAVVALTKRDLVDAATLEARTDDVRAAARGNAAGRRADRRVLVAHRRGHRRAARGARRDGGGRAAPRRRAGARGSSSTASSRSAGSGTVVTGTLTGGDSSGGRRRRSCPAATARASAACRRTGARSTGPGPVSRVAVNLAGTATDELGRGDVLVLPGQWRPTTAFEAFVEPVRGLTHARHVPGRVQAVRRLGRARRAGPLLHRVEVAGPGGRRRLRPHHRARPLVLDRHDRFVLREAGRRETVAGGRVVDAHPPARAGADAVARLRAMDDASPRATSPRPAGVGARSSPSADLLLRRGRPPRRTARSRSARGSCPRPRPREATGHLTRALAAHHAEHPLRAGMESGRGARRAARHDAAFADAALADAFVGAAGGGRCRGARGDDGSPAGARVSTAGSADADRLVAAVTAAETAPPTMRELTRPASTAS